MQDNQSLLNKINSYTRFNTGVASKAAPKTETSKTQSSKAPKKSLEADKLVKQSPAVIASPDDKLSQETKSPGEYNYVDNRPDKGAFAGGALDSRIWHINNKIRGGQFIDNKVEERSNRLANGQEQSPPALAGVKKQAVIPEDWQGNPIVERLSRHKGFEASSRDGTLRYSFMIGNKEYQGFLQNT